MTLSNSLRWPAAPVPRPVHVRSPSSLPTSHTGFLPQGLCPCCSLHLECSPPDSALRSSHLRASIQTGLSFSLKETLPETHSLKQVSLLHSHWTQCFSFRAVSPACYYALIYAFSCLISVPYTASVFSYH